MIVVSNTSPLTNLAAIGQFDLLRHLYSRVHIAAGVWEELNAAGGRWPGRDEVASAGWVKRHLVQNRSLVIVLQRDLDRGEAETIALALELQADVTLLDERDGRRLAQRLGLRVLGMVGVLPEAKAQGVIACVRPCLDGLRYAAGFYVDDALYAAALQLADEGEM